jgi:multidrug resistance efflux pump
MRRRTSKTGFLVNVIFFLALAGITVMIGTIALGKKIEQLRNAQDSGLVAAVVKPKIQILPLSTASVTTVLVSPGSPVTQGQILVTLANNALSARIAALSKFSNESSAAAKLAAAQEQLKALTVRAPNDGIVGDIYIAPGSSVDPSTPILDIYTDHNVRLYSQLTLAQYQHLRTFRGLVAYSQRLHQNFSVQMGSLSPSEDSTPADSEPKIGLYLWLANPTSAPKLLNNEALQLRPARVLNTAIGPLDILSDFWKQVRSST